MEKIILASGIVITCFATFAFSPIQVKDKEESTKANIEKTSTTTEAIAKEETKYQPVEDHVVYNINKQDTIPEKETIKDSLYNMNFNGTIDGREIKLKEDNAGIKELYVDGKKVPEDQYAQYKPLIDKLHKQMKENTLQLKLNATQLKLEKEQLQMQTEVLKKENEKMKEQQLQMQQDYSKQKELMQQQQLLMEQKAVLMKKNEALMKTQTLKLQKDLLLQQELQKTNQIELQKKVEQLQLKQLKLKIISDSMPIKKISLAQPAIKVNPEILVKPTISMQPVIKSTPSISAKPTILTQPKITATQTVAVKPVVYVTSSSLSEKIILDLKEANIITTTNNLSFRLTEDELIVNGIKQPEDIHQKILNKYLIKLGDSITFSYSNEQ